VWPAVLLFAVLGPGFELGLGPFVLTGFETGDGLPGSVVVRVLGATLLVTAVIASVDAIVRFARAGGTPSPLAPAPRPVREGVYALLRHPLYVATTAGLVGEALLLRRPILLIAAAVFAATMALVVRFVEEPRLRQRFGERWRSAGEGGRL
jgi:protein-S-isoprenylcysteine O-methyltransferase Ste14